MSILKYRIKNEDGTFGDWESIRVIRGKDGVDGKDGQNGGYYTPKVSFPGDNVLQFEFEPSVEDMPPVPSKTITIPAGKDGVGIKFVALNSNDTLTISYTDGTYYTSESIRGEKGKDGYSPVATVEQTAEGAVITITDKNGTTTATVTNGKDGTDGQDGSDGVSATHEWDGTVLKITSASGTSSANLKGEKGEKGEQGIQGPKGDQGKDGSDASVTATNIQNALGFTPANPSALSLGIHTDGLVYLFVSGQPVGNGIELSATGDVIGVLDASNNILLSGNLANGTYTLKYENADGTYTDIGTLEVGEAGPAYINLAEPNTTNTTDTTIWCNEARLAATGAVEAKTGYFVSNFVKVSKNQTLRFKNITLHRMGCYNESKTALTNACGTLSTLDTNDYIHDDYTTVDGVTTLRIENANVAYIRIAGQLTGTAEDVIITVDQEIV